MCATFLGSRADSHPRLWTLVAMLFSRLLTFLSKKHVMVLNLVFFCMFCVQFGSLVKNSLDHTELSTVMRKESLESQDMFPLTAKICVKPGFNQTELYNAGYEHALFYFLGQSRYKYFKGHEQVQWVYCWLGRTH